MEFDDEPGEPACLVHSSSLCGDDPECQPDLTGAFSDEPPLGPPTPDPRLDLEPPNSAWS